MKVKDLDYELSVKLGDPVTDNGEGETFTKEDRINYLRNGYSRLSRLLRILMRDYQPDFNKQRKIYKYENPDTAMFSFSIPAYISIDDVFLTVKYQASDKSYKTVTKQCAYISSTSYLSKKYGVNQVSVPSYEGDQYFYTIIDNKITFLPDSKTGQVVSFEMIYLPDLVKWEDNEEVPITREYLDLLLDLACVFGMQDIARGDKVQLIESSVFENLKILGQWATYRKNTEGVKE